MEQCSVITPDPKAKESMCYMTGLSVNTVKFNPNFSTDKIINELESKVMVRLIDVILPASPQKQ